jgi:hypothetical protein
MWNVRLVTVAVLALAGCGGMSNRPVGPATLQDAVQNLDSGLASIPYVSSSDLASEEQGRRYVASTKFVRDKQCSAGTANPLFLTSLPLSVRLTGNVGGDGRIEFSATKVEGTGGSTRVPPERGVEVLLRASTLADLPSEYLREMSALIEAKGLPDEVAQRLKKEVPGTYQKLTARISKLVSDFDPATCGVVARRTTPSQPAASRAEAPGPEKPRQERSAAGIFVPTF